MNPFPPMKPRKSLWKSWLEKLRKTEAAPEVRADRPLAKPAARQVVSSIEGLEGRIAPATLINVSTLQYTDFDGDTVTVKFNKNVLTDLASANAVFKFDAGTVLAGPTLDPTAQQLRLIDLTQIAATANGVSFTVTATPGATGNGLADVGRINATGLALGAVVIDGDLGKIDAGRNGTATALTALTVASLGGRGIATQDPGSTPDLVSIIRGALGALKVLGDVQDARLNVANGTPANGLTPVGKIGSIFIGGSLLGRTAVEAASNYTGIIDTTGTIGPVRIGTDASDGIFGGGGTGSGQINASGAIASVTVTGKILGGAGESSGGVFSRGAIGAIKIGTDTTGDIAGGSGATSGRITADGAITSVTIAGSLIGAGGASSGGVQAGAGIGAIRIGTEATDGIVGGNGASSGLIRAAGSIASVFVTGDVQGGGGQFSGGIFAAGPSITRIILGGDLAGGDGENSGRVQAGSTIGSISIGDDIIAGKGESSGGISSGTAIGTVAADSIDGRTVDAGLRSAGIGTGKLTSLSLRGSIFGGSAGQSGAVEIFGDVGSIAVAGNVVGGAGRASGSVIAHGKIAGVTVSGDIQGGTGIESGGILSGFQPGRVGDIGVIRVLGSVLGGDGDRSGSIRSGGKITSLSIGTTGAGPVDAVAGGVGDRSGAIESQGAMGLVRITGDVVGGAGDFSGTVRAFDRTGPTGEAAGALGAVSIGGQLRGGVGEGSGGVWADGNLTSLTVGSWNGGTGAESGSVRTGLGFVQPGNSGAIRVLGTMQANGTPGAGPTSLLVGGSLSSLTVGGVVDGASVRVGDALGVLNLRADVSDLLVTARGQAVPSRTANVAIGSITVVGSVTDSDFLAGYNLAGDGVNGDAQIGSVVVTGNWTASNLVAGVRDVDGDGFGNADDVAISVGSTTIVSRIASIVIGGTVSGTPAVANPTDHFGFTAQHILKMKVGAFAFPLSVAPMQFFDQAIRPALGSTGNDVSIREVV